VAITIATPTMWNLWTTWDGIIGSAVLSGIVGDQAHEEAPGKHLSWNANAQKFGTNSWPLRQPEDKNPANKNAAGAIDVSMSLTDMVKCYKLYKTVFDNRSKDPRAKYVSAFNGFDGSGSAVRIQFYDGAIYNTDDSHKWHQHTEVPYKYVDDPQMVRAHASILRGESIAQYLGQATPVQEEEDDMVMIPIEVPRGFAFDENEQLLDRKLTTVLPLEPIGFKDNPHFKGHKLLVSVGGDFNKPEGVLVRIAFQNGAGWSVHKILVTEKRQPVPVPAAGGDTAFNISIGRMRRQAESTETEADAPVTVIVSVVKA
jgi:hypothetical protein